MSGGDALLVGVVAAVFVIVLLLGVVVRYKFGAFKKGPRHGIDGRVNITNPAYQKKEDANENSYLDVAPEEWV